MFAGIRGILRSTFICSAVAVSLAGCGGGGSSSSGGGSSSGLPAPSGVSASAGNSQVTVSWNPVTGAASYNIYWSTSSGVSKTSGTRIPGASSPYVHSGLTNGATYYYVVTSQNSNGESTESAKASATPGLAPPPAP